MKFDIVLDGKTFQTELGIGKKLVVYIDNTGFQIESERAANGVLIHIGGKEYLVQFNGRQISVNGNKHDVDVMGLRRGRPSWTHQTDDGDGIGMGPAAHGHPSAAGSIHPPMPGLVASINVKVGDAVKAGEPLLVLEAMKMQNEIPSNMDGKVLEINVSEGDLVETKDVLVVIEK
jgi:biotin carboxyl carrier protein